MDLEKVALEAVKIKIQEVFDKLTVSTELEGKNIVIRIKLPDEIMNNNESHEKHLQARQKYLKSNNLQEPGISTQDLDKEAQSAANELLGNQPNISQE